jgi:hypothetical protein
MNRETLAADGNSDPPQIHGSDLRGRERFTVGIFFVPVGPLVD